MAMASRDVKQIYPSCSVPYRGGLVIERVTAGLSRAGCGLQNAGPNPENQIKTPPELESSSLELESSSLDLESSSPELESSSPKLFMFSRVKVTRIAFFALSLSLVFFRELCSFTGKEETLTLRNRGGKLENRELCSFTGKEETLTIRNRVAKLENGELIESVELDEER
ncbi:hypothetical protein F2Q68_00040722 [Brassica cretica]|uniref:Uncharacterized protein n=1 Tax=Brassica cretica TaxID=69181 RepID=A0A8S9MMM1_BRACR|nr:hypothetical protein F2Q68_00040722 [Brassica cretica]